MNTNKNTGLYLFHWAASTENIDYGIANIEELLTENPSLIDYENQYLDKATHIATKFDNLEILSLLIDKFNANINDSNAEGNLITIAINNGSKKCLSYLFNHSKIDLKFTDKTNNSIYHLLASKGNDFLIEKTLSIYPKGIDFLNDNKEHCLFNFIDTFNSHKNYFLFDLLLDKISKNTLKTKNINNMNVLEFTIYKKNISHSTIYDPLINIFNTFEVFS